MKKIAVFVEGQGEQIFVRNLLFHLVDPSVLSFNCFRLHANREHSAPYQFPNPNAEVYYQIVNVSNDEKVLSAIKEREKRLFNKGFVKIIGLRDMYSRAYRERSKGVINDQISKKFIESTAAVIAKMNNPEQISLHFSIMELEAWWLSMYNLFSKIDPVLTVDFIEKKLGYDLSTIDPEKYFFHPALEIGKILQLVGTPYKKRFGDFEKITSHIDFSDVIEAIDHNRCESFRKFCDDLTSY